MATNEIKAAIAAIYEARRDRRVHPEGTFDSARRWYPHDAEDGGGSGTSTRSPTRAWPFSYMLRCRTRAHVAILVGRALEGRAVPSDVRALLTARGLLGAPVVTPFCSAHEVRVLPTSRRAFEVATGLRDDVIVSQRDDGAVVVLAVYAASVAEARSLAAAIVADSATIEAVAS